MMGNKSLLVVFGAGPFFFSFIHPQIAAVRTIAWSAIPAMRP